MADKSTDTATLNIADASLDLPVYEGTLGPDAMDITSFYRDTGKFTYDPGFTSTASCESEITYIDGDEGILLYRGYPIEQLAEHGDFIETSGGATGTCPFDGELLCRSMDRGIAGSRLIL